MGKSVTVTVIANMTSNYSESLGNIASVQKIYRNQKEYAIRSRESLKNAIMIQSGMYDDLQTEVDGAAQKKVNETLNAANCRALEGGYMNTGNLTYKRNSSFYVTDSIIICIWQKMLQKMQELIYRKRGKQMKQV